MMYLILKGLAKVLFRISESIAPYKELQSNQNLLLLEDYKIKSRLKNEFAQLGHFFHDDANLIDAIQSDEAIRQVVVNTPTLLRLTRRSLLIQLELLRLTQKLNIALSLE